MHATVTAAILVLAILGSDLSRKASLAPASEPKGPRITFDTLVHDYGSIPFDSDGRCIFHFTNTGDAPLIITSFRSSCGCLAPDFDKDPVPPGGRGSVRLRYDTKRVGPINKSATLTSNATNTPELVLRIKGTVLADTASFPQPVSR